MMLVAKISCARTAAENSCVMKKKSQKEEKDSNAKIIKVASRVRAAIQKRCIRAAK